MHEENVVSVTHVSVVLDRLAGKGCEKFLFFAVIHSQNGVNSRRRSIGIGVADDASQHTEGFEGTEIAGHFVQRPVLVRFTTFGGGLIEQYRCNHQGKEFLFRRLIGPLAYAVGNVKSSHRPDPVSNPRVRECLGGCQENEFLDRLHTGSRVSQFFQHLESFIGPVAEKKGCFRLIVAFAGDSPLVGEKGIENIRTTLLEHKQGE